MVLQLPQWEKTPMLVLVLRLYRLDEAYDMLCMSYWHSVVCYPYTTAGHVASGAFECVLLHPA
jgi:hypothetical protein